MESGQWFLLATDQVVVNDMYYHTYLKHLIPLSSVGLSQSVGQSVATSCGINFAPV